MTLEEWYKEICDRHPILQGTSITEAIKSVKFNGWLPLPPKKPSEESLK